jgi:hypothetical protein
MYGGLTGTGGNLADTWEWDGISWTQIRTAHSPGPRLDAAFAYDAKRHRVVMFGGYSANYAGFRADTWEYDGVDWTLRSPATSLPALAAASMAWTARGTVVLYGGLSTEPMQGTATWEWNGTTWTRLFPVLNPGSRNGHRLATDAVNDNTC